MAIYGEQMEEWTPERLECDSGEVRGATHHIRMCMSGAGRCRAQYVYGDETLMRLTGMHGGVGKREGCSLQGRKGSNELSLWLFQEVWHTGLTDLTS